MRPSQTQKHKAACDQCNASKVKCPGGGIPCQRCADTSQPCHYSLARRIGKPPGSKNRRTLERLRQAKEGNQENNNGGGSGVDSSIPRNSSDGEREFPRGDGSHDPLPMSSTTSFWPLSPLINYQTFPDASQFMPTPDQDFLEGDSGVAFDGGDRPVLHSADPKFPDFGDHGRTELRMPWVDATEDCRNVSIFPWCEPTLSNRRVSLRLQAVTSSSL